MKNLVIKKGIYKYQLQIDKIKYCLGFNFVEKYQFKNMLFEYFYNSKLSEYSKENIGEVCLEINENKIKNRDVSFYYVDHNYSIDIDLKLNSKSLISAYLEMLLLDEQYIDTINSINILFEAFASELDDNLITSKFITYTPKQFLKILSPMFCYEEEQANEHDLSYNELIIFQLNMINYIAKKQQKIVICLVEIPELTIEINEILKNMNNCIVIVLLCKYNLELNLKDIILFDNIVLDLNDEEQLYNYFIDKGVYTVQEAKDKMKKIIDNGITKIDMSILKD